MSNEVLSRIGLVAIGRNEGERLKRCLRSIPQGLAAVVYVDSGSTDGSVEHAKSTGAEVVSLDMTIPFTAARARNAGWRRLVELHPQLTLVQFVDGDCELADGWVEAAAQALERDPQVAVVCGRRRELHPDATHFNRLCDMEWNTPIGETDACGGDALFRIQALVTVGGYDDSVIAGEEPELCLRLRRQGFKVLRIDHEMTRHDAAITRWSQWWLRNVRAGHACAEGHYRYGDGPERFYKRALASNLVWGLGVPAVSLGLALPTLGTSLGLLGLYGVLYQRARADRLRRGDSPEDAALYAKHIVIGKLPNAQGILEFHSRRLRRVQNTLIEYK